MIEQRCKQSLDALLLSALVVLVALTDFCASARVAFVVASLVVSIGHRLWSRRIDRRFPNSEPIERHRAILARQPAADVDDSLSVEYAEPFTGTGRADAGALGDKVDVARKAR